jgi:two-component system nitrogen regulation response regulator GlnG
MAELLLIDDQDRYLQLLQRALPEHRYRGPARDWAAAREQLDRAGDRIDLVLLDVHFDIEPERLVGHRDGMKAAEVESLKRRQGLEILTQLRQRHPELPVIVMTSRDELDLESTAAAGEEYTYFLDDEMVDAQMLRAQIEGIVGDRRDPPRAGGPVFWGGGLAMRRLEQRLAILARGRLPVVLLGPTGTGKSLMARHVVHARSGRTGRFVAVDLATLPRDLMAGHLFGSVRGAYTGSVADRAGAFEEADGGTLFLDEVGNLSLDAQKMLLSVLQDATVTRLGDTRERPVDVKVVVATNEDLAQRVAEGSFRADLYMRLNPATAVTLPSLAERGVDYAELLGFCVQQAQGRPNLQELVAEHASTRGVRRWRVEVHAGSGVPPEEPNTLWLWFPERVMRRLRAHPWPGNLREFGMVVENVALFVLSEALAVPGGDRPDVIAVRPKLLADLLRGPSGATDDGWRVEVSVTAQDTLNRVAVACERQYFEALYLREGGDFGRMAQVLLDDPEAGRKVQLRFNQLGLKVRELKARL